MQQDASGWISGKLDKESDRNIWHVECLASEVSCATKRDIDKAWHGHRLLPCNKMPSQQDKALNLDSQSILKAGKGQILDYVLNSRIPYNLGPCSKISQKFSCSWNLFVHCWVKIGLVNFTLENPKFNHFLDGFHYRTLQEWWQWGPPWYEEEPWSMSLNPLKFCLLPQRP